MTDYTKTTDFGVKDGLSTGNASKLVKGSEFDTEFDAIETAVATKADKASPTFTGTVTGANVTVNGTFKLADTSDDHYYTWAVNELTADRTVTWPLLTGNDTIVFEAHTATLTNKTIDLTSNTLTGTTAQFNTALSDGSFATLAGTETLTNKTINGSNNTITNVSLSTGISGLGTGVGTFLATPSSANLASAVTDETGSGALVFGTSPTIATPTLTLKQGTSPTPTAEGAIEWDTDDDAIIVGDGSSQKKFYPAAAPVDEGIQFYVGTTPTIDAGGLAYDEASGIAKLKINADDSLNFAYLQMGSDQIPLVYLDAGQPDKIALNNIFQLDLATKTTIGAAGALSVVASDSGTISNEASVAIRLDYTSILGTTISGEEEYPDEVIIKFWNLIPATDNASLYLRLDATAGGGDSGASDYRSGTTDAAQITIAAGVGSDTNENGASGEIRIFTPNSASYTQVRASGTNTNSANNIVAIDVAAQRNSATAMTYAYLLFSSGNIESGKIGVYYVKSF